MLRTVSLDGTELKILVMRHDEDRLKTTCFRGHACRCAGNFTRWIWPSHLFNDEQIYSEFLAHMRNICGEGPGTDSFTIEHADYIGWESTGELAGFDADALEPFKPNRKSEALKVKTSRIDLKAPKTKLVTFVVEYRDDDRGPVAIIRSMYPGEDIGNLAGNVTVREQRVFYDWNHPGE